MISGQTFERIDNFGSSLKVGGEKYRKGPRTIGQALTVLGPTEFKRARYRPASGLGENIVLKEQQLGLTKCGLTSAVADLSMALLSSLTARKSEDVWKRIAGEGPSTCTLMKLSSKAGQCLEDCSTEVMTDFPEREESPENATMLLVSTNGVTMRMNTKKMRDEIIEDTGWREVSCGVVSLHDKDGNKLRSRFFG